MKLRSRLQRAGEVDLVTKREATMTWRAPPRQVPATALLLPALAPSSRSNIRINTTIQVSVWTLLVLIQALKQYGNEYWAAGCPDVANRAFTAARRGTSCRGAYEHQQYKYSHYIIFRLSRMSRYYEYS
eukprot:scaffold7534_cov18-Prasinocladus_malaysianus.AAC.1